MNATTKTLAPTIALSLLLLAPAVRGDDDDAATTAPAATAPAATTQAASADPAELAALLAGLGADDTAARDAAQRQLLELDPGDDLTAALRKARVASRDPDVRMRLDTLLAERAERALVGPSKVTLKLDDVPVTDALAAFSKATGARFDDQMLRNNGGPNRSPPRVSVDIRGASYFRALTEFGQAAGVRFQPRGDRTLYVMGANNFGGRDMYAGGYESGAFYVQPVVATYSRSVAYQNNVGAADGHSFTLQLQLSPEPKLRMPANANPAVRLRRAVDSNGNDLAGGNARSNNAYGNDPVQVNLQLAYPQNPGDKIAELSGTVRVSIATRLATLDVEDLAAADAGPIVRDVGGLRVEIRPTPQSKDAGGDAANRANQPAQVEFAATIVREPGTRNGNGNGLAEQLQTALAQAVVTNGEGRAMRPMGSSTNDNGDRIECRFTFSTMSPRGAGAKSGAPYHLHCDVPTSFRELDVPFTLKDLKMP